MNYTSAHIPARLWVNSLNIIFFFGNFFLRNTTENTINWCIEWFIIGKLCSGYMYYFKCPKWTKLCSTKLIKKFMAISFSWIIMQWYILTLLDVVLENILMLIWKRQKIDKALGMPFFTKVIHVMAKFKFSKSLNS